MGSPEHLVCFHCTTGRALTEDSESEEETVSGISWIAVDVKSNQVTKILAVTCYGLSNCVGVSLVASEKNSRGLWGRFKSVMYFCRIFLL